MSKKLIFFATVLLLLGISAAVIVRANGGVIHACVNPAGQLRIVGTPEDCRPQEEELDWNEQGLPGEDGEDGADGAPGSPGLSDITVIGEWGDEDSVDSKTHMVWCPEGKKAISGGYNISGGGPNIVVRTFHPQWQPGEVGAPTGWQVSAHEIVPTDEEWSIRAVALCANVEE